MPDFDNEEQFQETIRNAYKPVPPSPEFQDRLHSLLLSEVNRSRRRPLKKLWSDPLLWAATTAAIILIVLSLALWGRADQPPVVMPEPGTSPAVTAPAADTPTPEPTPSTSPAPSTEPSAEPSPEPTPTTPASPPLMAGTGTLEIRVTDAPAQDVTELWVNLSHIQVHQAIEETDGTEDDEDWTTVIEGPVSFDLILLKEEGIEKILGSTEIYTGHYTKIRMDVAVDYAIIDGETVTDGIKIPSEVLQTAGNFDIEEGKTTTLTFDFDVEKSLVITGSGTVNFMPVVKLIVTGPE